MGWLDNYGKEENPNDSSLKGSPEILSLGTTSKGRNYSPAWGGQFQSGGKMNYYRAGLDFEPKTISQSGSVITDEMGQWAHPGEITRIPSNDITMEGVPYPVLGISDTGDTKMMKPNKKYKFKGSSVTEYPQLQDGRELDQLTNFTNYNTKQPGGWLDQL